MEEGNRMTETLNFGQPRIESCISGLGIGIGQNRLRPIRSMLKAQLDNKASTVRIEHSLS